MLRYKKLAMILKRLEGLIWKIVALVWEVSPTRHLPMYRDYPIASAAIEKDGKYTYPKGIEILFEWDEKGKHWIVFTRSCIDL
jgi:hypothetical protein